MVALETPICDFDWKAPSFSLPATDGKTYKLSDIVGQNGTLVMFICNHCPFVKSILDDLIADCETLQGRGIGVAAISSNDADTYPEDSFDNMKKLALPFPYLYDEDQSVAKAYDAVCTPDFFGFDKDGGLQYRGRFDDRRMNHTGSGKHELLTAMTNVVETGKFTGQQIPSIGCSIKWKGV